MTRLQVQGFVAKVVCRISTLQTAHPCASGANSNTSIVISVLFFTRNLVNTSRFTVCLVYIYSWFTVHFAYSVFNIFYDIDDHVGVFNWQD